MNATGGRDQEADRLRRATDLAVRLILVALLVYWCFLIFRPFLMPVAMGVVLAVALYPVYFRAERLLRGRKKLAATLVVLLCLAVLLVPTFLLSGSAVEGVLALSTRLQEGTISIPPAPEKVASWPLIGQPIFETWNAASTNLGALVQKMLPQVKVLGLWLISVAKQAAGAVLFTVVALVIAGFLWVRSESALAAATAVGARLGKDRGAALIPLAGRAIRTVAKGVIGVAAIQAILAAVGFVAAGVPGAGLWALLVLILAVAQLPPLLVLVPAILYLVVADASTATVVLFAVWSLVVSFSDAALKPLLMGRGSDIPVAVILIGAIGGMLLHGLIGLFVGAVVFSIGHGLISEWIHKGGGDAAPAGGEQAQ